MGAGMKWMRGLLLAALLGVAAAALAADGFRLKDGQRVLFLGDSNTYAGGYVQYLEAFLATRFPDRRFELINAGLASETVTGLSEPDHPFPRPNVHERLDRALAKTRPDLVVACYGMNDGIYYPFSEERFRKYQDGIRELARKVRETGAALVLVTPPPFDPAPVRDKVLPAGALKWSWMNPYAGYDEVLTRYSEWLLSLRKEGYTVVDAHGPVTRYLEAVRKTEPGFRVAGDGVHVDATGHWLLAGSLLDAWNAPAEADRAELDARERRARDGRVTDLTVNAGEIGFRWESRLPLPLDPAWHPRLSELTQMPERLNRYRLKVTGLSAPRYVLWEGETRLGEVTRQELSRGLDLTRLPQLSTNRQALELLKRVREKERILGPAWLSAIGHQRPGTPAGLPMEEARRRAAPLEAEIRRLARPVRLSLRLTAVRE